MEAEKKKLGFSLEMTFPASYLSPTEPERNKEAASLIRQVGNDLNFKPSPQLKRRICRAPLFIWAIALDWQALWRMRSGPESAISGRSTPSATGSKTAELMLWT